MCALEVDWSQERFIVEMHGLWSRGQPLVPMVQWPQWLKHGVELVEGWLLAEQARQRDLNG